MLLPDRLLTFNEVAAFYRVHPETVRRMADRGELTRLKVGPHAVRFDPREVEAVVSLTERDPAVRPGHVEAATAVGVGRADGAG